jgi:ornithine decarboxylase
LPTAKVFRLKETPKPFLSDIGIENTLEKLRSLISRYATRSQGAFYVMSPPALKRQIDLWHNELPTVFPFYAIKCNPDPTILHAVHDAGLHFDCASRRELLSIRELARVSSDATRRIIYANPCKSERDIAFAKEMGSPTTVVDSIEELDKLKGYGGGALIRIAVDDSGSKMPFSTKFGARKGIVKAISWLAQEDTLPIHGISFHVGSACGGGKAYWNAIRAAYAALQEVRRMGHPSADTIDIGGGYLPCASDFKEKAVYIRDAMMEINRQELSDGQPGVRYIAEPGRFFATKTYDFFVQVIGKKRMKGGWSYTIDDSVYGQFTSILFDHAEPLWVRIQNPGEKPRGASQGVLFGRTCDSVDVIARADHMEELEVGDWLWFPGMGAYTRATASEFNGFPVPPVFVDTTYGEQNVLAVQDVRPKGVHYMPAVRAADFWSSRLTV